MSELMTDIDEARAVQLLTQADVPAPIVDVARRLQDAGHAAVLVGGAVRDVLLDLPSNDWDLASSATPDEVMALFRKTIPTGVQHGTVTVLVRDGKETHPVEITTFRGEGAYVDGRRPGSVRFLRNLIEDLARRDFTVNAFAWDPVERRFSDPFNGLADMAAGVLRAVGVAVERFREDGLRTMRAVRFCATRNLRLEAETEAAIPDALDVLAKVSRERVHVELTKMLSSERPSQGLRPMWRTGIWPHVLLPLASDEDYESALAAVDAMPREPVSRVARLLWPLARDPGASKKIEACVEALKPSKAERATVLALTGPAAQALEHASDPVDIRRAVARLRREYLEAALHVQAVDDERRRQIEDAVEGAALTVGELAIKGRDLIEQGVVTKGPQVGRLLAALLDAVIETPELNSTEGLLERARAEAG